MKWEYKCLKNSKDISNKNDLRIQSLKKCFNMMSVTTTIKYLVYRLSSSGTAIYYQFLFFLGFTYITYNPRI